MLCSVVTKDARGSQLTIFYGGQVLVFDDIQAKKAKDILSFAGKGMSQNQNDYANTFPATTSANPTRPFPFLMNIIPTSANNSVQDHPQAPSKPVICGNFFGSLMFIQKMMRDLCVGLCISDPSRFVFLFVQIYHWLGKLHFIGSWRKERIGK